jgi:hypothetical protein
MSSSYYFEKISQQVVHPLHAFEATSPRKVLFGINLLLAVAAIVITSYSVYLVQLLYDPHFFTGEYLAVSELDILFNVPASPYVSQVGSTGSFWLSLAFS